MATAYIGLGSNLGDRLANLRRAARELEALGIRITALSPAFRTAPVGRVDQPEFLNQAAAVRTGLEPGGLLALCQGIEVRMGRRRILRDGPRVIDLDILLYEDRAVTTPELTVPHPRMHMRRFVLVPLCEIDPGILHPVLHRTVGEILRDLRSDEPAPVVLDGRPREPGARSPAGLDRRPGLG